MVKREPEEWSSSVPLHRRRRRRTETWLLFLLHHQPIIFDVRKSESRERRRGTERERNYKRKGGRIELEDRRTEGGGEERENIGVPSWADNLPLMKYIVKFREGKERGSGLRDVVREGTIRKVATSR